MLHLALAFGLLAPNPALLQRHSNVGRPGAVFMKAPARQFKLSDWYGDDWDHKKPIGDDLWVSPWAKAHYKLRQQEVEIEQCEFLLQSAVEAEDYAEADGLKQRIERLRSQHPIIPREERLAAALEDANYALAAIFQQDLEAVKTNLGLPKYVVGQAVVHAHRDGVRGVIIDVDLQCTKSVAWVNAAGCLERGCALGYPGEETELRELRKWTTQPFYTVLPDLAHADESAAKGAWRWPWPVELASWEVNQYKGVPAALYLSEDALSHDPDAETNLVHPEMAQLFDGFDATPHRGRVYRPKPRLRLWQQKRQAEQQQQRTRNTAARVGHELNPYDRMG